jgi:hypothetical protein
MRRRCKAVLQTRGREDPNMAYTHIGVEPFNCTKALCTVPAMHSRGATHLKVVPSSIIGCLHSACCRQQALTCRGQPVLHRVEAVPILADQQLPHQRFCSIPSAAASCQLVLVHHTWWRLGPRGTWTGAIPAASACRHSNSSSRHVVRCPR